MSKWICVEDGLPEVPYGESSSETVLVYVHYGGKYGASAEVGTGVLCFFPNGDPYWVVSSFYRYDMVSHWMRLPELPRGVGDGVKRAIEQKYMDANPWQFE